MDAGEPSHRDGLPFRDGLQHIRLTQPTYNSEVACSARLTIHPRLEKDAYMRPPRIPNWLPGDADTIYFLTLCVQGRQAVLDNLAAWSLCRAVWKRLDRWHIHAAIAMPDHLHLLLSPLGDRDASLNAWMKWFKRWFNRLVPG